MENSSIKDFDNSVFVQNFSDDENFETLILANNNIKCGLSSCVKYIYWDFENNLCLNDEISNKLVLEIALELAQAIDKNSVIEIKRIKEKYLATSEFVQAKNFLDKKCKEIWSVFDEKLDLATIPKEAMKALGITNQPSLDYLLDNSLNYFEKDNGSTTVDIISSTLSNKKISYTFQDIYLYLKKRKPKFNMVTTSYLCEKLDFDVEKLNSIGIDKSTSWKIFKRLSIKNKINYLIKNYLLQFCK